MFEDLAFLARRDLVEIRLNERKIQSLLVRSAKMPRKDFIAQYPDNATKVKWIDTLMKSKKYSKKHLRKLKPMWSSAKRASSLLKKGLA